MLMNSRHENIRKLKEVLAFREELDLTDDEKDKISQTFQVKYGEGKDLEQAIKDTADELDKEIGSGKVMAYLQKESDDVHLILTEQGKRVYLKYDSKSDTFFVRNDGGTRMVGSGAKAKEKFQKGFLDTVKGTPDKWVRMLESDIQGTEVDTREKESIERSYRKNLTFVKNMQESIVNFFTTFFPDHIAVDIDSEFVEISEVAGLEKDQFIYNMKVGLVDSKQNSRANFMITFDFPEAEVAVSDLTLETKKGTMSVQSTPLEPAQIMQSVKRLLTKYREKGIYREEYNSCLLRIFEVKENLRINLKRLHNNKLGEFFFNKESGKKEILEAGSTIRLINCDPDMIVFQVNEDQAFELTMFDKFKMEMIDDVKNIAPVMKKLEEDVITNAMGIKVAIKAKKDPDKYGLPEEAKDWTLQEIIKKLNETPEEDSTISMVDAIEAKKTPEKFGLPEEAKDWTIPTLIRELESKVAEAVVGDGTGGE